MPEADEASGSRGSGRRRRRVPGGRHRVFRVRVTEEEQARLVATAERHGMGVPMLLYTAAVEGGAETTVTRREEIQQLWAIERQLAAIGNNINQIARVANTTGDVPSQIGPVLDRLLVLVDRVEQAADAVIEA